MLNLVNEKKKLELSNIINKNKNKIWLPPIDGYIDKETNSCFNMKILIKPLPLNSDYITDYVDIEKNTVDYTKIHKKQSILNDMLNYIDDDDMLDPEDEILMVKGKCNDKTTYNVLYTDF